LIAASNASGATAIARTAASAISLV
jgi:hypothetical protein